MGSRSRVLTLMAKGLKQLPYDFLFYIRVCLTRSRLRQLANKFVTPFTPFVLSDWYLSNEIDSRHLQFLNDSSRRLTSQNVSAVLPGAVIYVQVDQLDKFEAMLPNIRSKILLLTGKWGLPGLEDSELLRRILDSGKIDAWWSQNQVFPKLPIQLFPYGLDLFTLPKLEKRIASTKRKVVSERRLLYVPFARVHKHLSGPELAVRRDLEPYMDKPLPQDKYFKEISKHRFVVSPRGDRPDTYRHYEALALGATPVTDLPDVFKEVFGKDIVFVPSLIEVAKSPEPLMPCAENIVDASIIEVRTWKNKIRSRP